MQNLTIKFFNVHEISWLAEELLVNEGMYSTEYKKLSRYN